MAITGTTASSVAWLMDGDRVSDLDELRTEVQRLLALITELQALVRDNEAEISNLRRDDVITKSQMRDFTHTLSHTISDPIISQRIRLWF